MDNIKKHIKLSELDNESPFRVPNNYFDTFKDDLLSKIDDLETEKNHKGIIFYFKPILTVAASFAVVFLLVYYPIKALNSKITTSKNENIFTEVEFMALNYNTDHEVIECIERINNTEPIDDLMLESILLASMSEFELMELN